MGTPADGSGDDAFAEERAFVVQLAYRMLGSVHDAEDVAQESWLRWRSSAPADVERPRAWFARTATRLCIDRLRASRRERERYHGEWLPEPWVGGREPARSDAPVELGGGAYAAPDDRATIDDTLSLALLHTLQRLGPAERAVFLLHDVFGYAFDDVAPIVDLEAANCRQLAVRARKRLEGPPRRRSAAAEAERLGTSFFAALRDGDTEALERTLHEEVVLRADGGGKVAAVHYPLIGRARVTRFFDRIYVRPRAFELGEVEGVWFNGSPGFLVRERDAITAAYQFEIADGAIVSIHVQRNPDKLLAIARDAPRTER